jgi:ribonuclease E
VAAVASGEQSEEGNTGAREGARRRGRRGGRRERERRDNNVQAPEANGNNEAATPVQEVVSAPVAPSKVKPTEYVAYPEGYVAPVKPTEYVAYPEGYGISEKPAHTSPVAAATPVAPVMQVNGERLIQIETDPSKFSLVAHVPNSEPQPATRRRQRQREVYVESEPLVQIETQRT